MLDSCKMLQKQSEAFHTFLWLFPSLKHNFLAYHSSKVSSHPDCIFEIHQLWQSGFSKVYSNCYCSCSFEAEIMKIGQSSHKMYSNKILKFPKSTSILNACTKKSGNLLKVPRMCIDLFWSISQSCLYPISVAELSGPLSVCISEMKSYFRVANFLIYFFPVSLKILERVVIKTASWLLHDFEPTYQVFVAGKMHYYFRRS